MQHLYFSLKGSPAAGHMAPVTLWRQSRVRTLHVWLQWTALLRAASAKQDMAARYRQARVNRKVLRALGEF